MKTSELLIAGGAGFVGRNLVRVLQSSDYEMGMITVVDKDGKNLEYVKKFGVKAVQADMAEKGDWFDEFNGKKMVINLAAQISSPSYDDFHRNNVISTKNVIEATRAADIDRIIHFSSAAVLSIRKDDYAKSKLEGEEMVKKSGVEYCILQPSLMYGPTDDKNIGYLINFAKKIMGNFPHNKVYSVNGKEVIYFRDMIKIVLKQLGGFKFRVFLPISLFKFLMMSYQLLAGKTRFTSDQVDSLTAEEVFPNYAWWDEFGIDITSFDEGVRRMLNHSDMGE
jgi:nucleoside-diphosphate-sugar epimerase